MTKMPSRVHNCFLWITRMKIGNEHEHAIEKKRDSELELSICVAHVI